MMKTSHLAKIKALLDIPNTKILFVTDAADRVDHVIKMLISLPGDLNLRRNRITYNNNSYIEIRKVTEIEEAHYLAGYEFEVIIFDIWNIDYDVYCFLKCQLRTKDRVPEIITLWSDGMSFNKDITEWYRGLPNG
jgi:hypothetical protein